MLPKYSLMQILSIEQKSEIEQQGQDQQFTDLSFPLHC